MTKRRMLVFSSILTLATYSHVSAAGSDAFGGARASTKTSSSSSETRRAASPSTPPKVAQKSDDSFGGTRKSTPPTDQQKPIVRDKPLDGPTNRAFEIGRQKTQAQEVLKRREQPVTAPVAPVAPTVKREADDRSVRKDAPAQPTVVTGPIQQSVPRERTDLPVKTTSPTRVDTNDEAIVRQREADLRRAREKEDLERRERALREREEEIRYREAHPWPSLPSTPTVAIPTAPSMPSTSVPTIPSLPSVSAPHIPTAPTVPVVVTPSRIEAQPQPRVAMPVTVKPVPKRSAWAMVKGFFVVLGMGIAGWFSFTWWRLRSAIVNHKPSFTLD